MDFFQFLALTSFSNMLSCSGLLSMIFSFSLLETMEYFFNIILLCVNTVQVNFYINITKQYFAISL